MADPLSGLRALAAAVKQMAKREDVPRYRWATVTSAGAPPEVVLEDDLTGAPRKVTASAIGAVQVGWRVRVERVRRNLTIVAAPALSTVPGPWVDCAPASGFIGTLRVRTLGPLLTEVDCNLTGTVPVGATELTAAIPATHRPASGTHRIEGSANNFPVGGYAGSSGQLGVIQQTGASRTGVAMRGTWSRV